MRGCKIRAAAGALAFGLLSGAAAAQPAPAGARQADALPSLAVPAKELADERKYFILHKPGVTVAEAEADLRFCWRYLARGAQRMAPDFVAWRSGEPARRTVQPSNNFGLVGAAIGAIIAGPIDRSLRQSRIFRCMVPRGYARYRTSDTLWKALNGGDPERAIALQARIAAGPVPPTPPVTR